MDSDFESEKEDGDAFIVALAAHTGNDTWLIDLVASFHMACNRNWFSEYEQFDGGKVYLVMTLILILLAVGK